MTSKQIISQLYALINQLENSEACRGDALQDELIILRDAVVSYDVAYDSRAENYEPESRAYRSAEQAYKESREWTA